MPLEDHFDSDTMKSLEGYGIKDLDHLAKQFVTTRKNWDTSVRVPGENASETERSAYLRKIGVPDSPSDYQIPQQTTQSQFGRTLEMLKDFAHQSQMPVKTWDGLVEKASDASEAVLNEQLSEIDTTRKQWEEAAKEQLGDDYGQKRADAERMLKKLSDGDQALQDIFESTGIVNHPQVLDAFATVAKVTSGSTTPETLGGGVTMDPTAKAQQLALEIKKIYASEEFRDSQHHAHSVAMEEYMAKQKELAGLDFRGATDPRLRT